MRKLWWTLTVIGAIALIIIIGEVVYVLVDFGNINVGRVLMTIVPAGLLSWFGIRGLRKQKSRMRKTQ